jgi:hypothetical protein
MIQRDAVSSRTGKGAGGERRIAGLSVARRLRSGSLPPGAGGRDPDRILATIGRLLPLHCSRPAARHSRTVVALRQPEAVAAHRPRLLSRDGPCA